MSVGAGNKLKRHVQGAHLIIFVSAGRTESAFAAKSNKFKFSTMRATIKSSALRVVTAMNHLVDIFNDSRTRMEFVNDVFIIIGKDGL